MSGSDPIVSMIGPGSAPAMLAARALLVGNGVRHRWIDTDADPVGRLLAENVHLGAERPVAVFADGSQLSAPEEFVDPTPSRVAEQASALACQACCLTLAGLGLGARSCPALMSRWIPDGSPLRSCEAAVVNRVTQAIELRGQR